MLNHYIAEIENELGETEPNLKSHSNPKNYLKR